MVELITALARQMPDRAIASLLNRAGKKTRKSLTWNRSHVCVWRNHRRVEPYREGERHAFVALILQPLLARAAIQLLFLTTPYVRPGGLGIALADHMRRGEILVTLLSSASGACLSTWPAGLWAVGVAVGAFLLMRRSMRIRISGATGDTAGALVEVTEICTLLAFCFTP